LADPGPVAGRSEVAADAPAAFGSPPAGVAGFGVAGEHAYPMQAAVTRSTEESEIRRIKKSLRGALAIVNP
jgi:hypothetical protein